MKLHIQKNQVNMAGEQFLRQAGYGYIRDYRSGQDSFVRRLGSGHYPRLHMYCDENNSEIILSLHLDQKEARYEGVNAHNAEYDGEVVSSEINRLKMLINTFSSPSFGQKKKEDKPEPKGFWDKIFG